MLVVNELLDHDALLAQIEAALSHEVRKKVNATLNYAFDRLVQYTPVWSGRAMNSHSITIGHAEYANRGPIGMGPPGSGRTSAAKSAFASRKPRLGPNDDPYTVVYITNAAAYSDGSTIEDLEFGNFPKANRPPEGIFGKLAIDISAKYGRL